MNFVLDASATLPWAFANQAISFDQKLLRFLADHTALVSQIWSSEILNCLYVAVRRGDMDQAEPEVFTGFLKNLPIHVQAPLAEHGFHELPSLIERYQLSSYDACYVGLALRLDIPIASHDNNVRQAAGHLGIQVLEESDLK